MTAVETSPLAGSEAENLLRSLSQWGPTTTVVLHGGCVFEFKGPFPDGSVGEGYYNLTGSDWGFHGHIRLDAVHSIGFQQRQHRGRDSYAFVFLNKQGETLFKVFLGRDPSGCVYPDQIRKFQQIMTDQTVTAE